MSKLDHVVTNKIKNKYQCNDAIKYENIFDNNFILSSGTKDTLPVATVSLRGGKKHRETIIDSLKCLWYRVANNRMIKRRHNKPYYPKICSNKVDCTKATGLYCITHDVKVKFCMPQFSISKIILHQFHIDNNKGESCIGYDIIIGLGLIVQLGLWTKFKRQALQWDGDTVTIK